jgi:serine/threonine-protein kinase
MALVLELVEGRTLADRIAAGVIPMAEAVPIASQIAAAVEAAHEQGIIHRDLKPANVKVREDGTVKVLDFGLAKALSLESDRPTSSVMNSPTITAHGTAIGMILGTAAYMAPEQAKGKAADKRADMWAFGVVLFEMLTGRRLFDGETAQETLAHVMMREIDLGQLPPSTPPRLRELIGRCLVKDPKRRLRDIGEARIVLEDPTASSFASATSVAPAPSAPPSLIRRLLPIVVSCVVTAVIVGGLVRYFRPQPAPPAVTRFAVTLPADQRFEGFGRRALGFSPDGTQLVYQVSAVQLFVRSMADGTAKAVLGTDRMSIRSPTFSPDNQSLVFWAVNDRTLKTLPLGGGAAGRSATSRTIPRASAGPKTASRLRKTT